MKIFSNFDTQLEKDLYQEAIQEHGVENVRVVHRSQVFFLLRVLIPGLGYLIISVIAFLLPILMGVEDTSILRILYGLLTLFFLVGIFSVGWKILKEYIDYKMDFTIITPVDIRAFNQTGLFSRNQRLIDVSKIKTVTVDKAGIIKSFFNFGSIKILTEGDSDTGDIMLYYVEDPDFVSEEISRITKFAQEGGMGD